jgi:hypothetical protein
VNSKGKTAAEQIKILVRKSIADGFLNEPDAKKLAQLIGQVKGNADLLQEICMYLPTSAFRTVCEQDRLMAKLLITVFCQQITT